MRWIGVPCALASCALVAGCTFKGPAGAAPDADTAGDGPVGMSDGMSPDGPPGSAVRTRRIEITDAQVAGGPHTDFPLLVSITEPWLRGTAAGGGVASPSGFDLGFFADAAGTTRLAHEVELYRGDTGALIAWVKVPSLSAATELFLRYGDASITASQERASAVWSNGFSGVWHLGGLGDSTTNGNTGANSGSTATGGRIGDGRGFDGADDFVDLGSATSIDDVFTGGGTVEAWFRATDWGGAKLGRILEKGDASDDVKGWALCIDDVNVSRSLRFMHGSSGGAVLRGAWNTPASSAPLNAWTHVAVVYDRGSTLNDPTFYINGAAVTESEIAPPGGAMLSDASFAARIGNRGAGDRTFEGQLDEVRLSTVSRSAGWIQTSVRNQGNPGAFYTVGPEL